MESCVRIILYLKLGIYYWGTARVASSAGALAPYAGASLKVATDGVSLTLP